MGFVFYKVKSTTDMQPLVDTVIFAPKPAE
jgi:hypothetical protein